MEEEEEEEEPIQRKRVLYTVTCHTFALIIINQLIRGKITL